MATTLGQIGGAKPALGLSDIAIGRMLAGAMRACVLRITRRAGHRHEDRDVCVNDAKRKSSDTDEMRLLLIEDDDMIGRGLLAPFQKAGIAVDWVRTGADAREAFRADLHSLVLLDVGLPDACGFDLLGEIRASGRDVPVLMLTARDAVEDRVAGLDGGADDYLVKPFSVDELVARVRALTRRRGGSATSFLEAGTLGLDLASQELVFEGERRHLTAREFALMRIFMERPGTILSRAQIEDRLYGWGAEVESNAVEVLIHSVRRKTGRDVIRNVRGAGWMIAGRSA